jgi:hypothetical protein
MAPSHLSYIIRIYRLHATSQARAFDPVKKQHDIGIQLHYLVVVVLSHAYLSGKKAKFIHRWRFEPSHIFIFYTIYLNTNGNVAA